mmetsp:Transcript_1682/g.3884  ORF Transcript_1682/g.3884 Transcript_1682/m.3884 type:complete len:274 (+) Transcript_1682:1082-1903(+)
MEAPAFLRLGGRDGLHADRLVVFKEQAHGHLARQHLEPLAGLLVLWGLWVQQRLQVALPGTRAHALRRDGHVHCSKALLLEAVHVLRPRIASLLSGGHEGVVDGAHGRRPLPRHRQGAGASSVGRLSLRVALGLLVVGQHVPVGPRLPAGADLLRPALVVQGVASHVGHGIQARGPAQRAAPRLVQPPAVHVLLGHCVEVPVVLGIGQVVGQRCRHVDLPPVPAAHVASAVLNEQNVCAGIFHQAMSDGGASRASAHDDVVVASSRREAARKG